ncbi:uncharacterized protein LOC114527034 [Dendronephthya gigantea]|uniref:uncharacterized protein LOC114527034 n=1 Tax=Dendronephthya gigantea TaxID=151771 RepID=UPI001069BBC1|nr:uncharacterized protein LOC114527034 [Dendronephthya gigantea]
MDNVIHSFSLKETSDKKGKEKIKKDVAISVCAFSNSNGGNVEIRVEETEGNLVSTAALDSLTRMLEQSLISRFGVDITKSVDFKEEKHEKIILIKVRKVPSLVTYKCNLYRPLQKQVELIGNVQIALKIMSRRFVDQPVQLGSHHKTFHKGQDCGFVEDVVIQFKLVMAAPSKRVTLADRMTGKSNKFSCYVSAFANHRGGHIYYGIDDDGIVQGEETEKNSEVLNKVEKAIQKMIWPDVIGQPKRGEHWEIFFQPVLDEKSNPIPSTFVIVIFIAPCFGGVFTEEPESYEMVEGKVERMPFITLKEKLQPAGQKKRKQKVPSAIKRISLSSASKKRCLKVLEVLTDAINNGEMESFESRASQLERSYPNDLGVQLVVLARRVMACYRRGNICEASVLVNEKQELFIRAGEPFSSVFVLLKAALECVSGESSEPRDILTHALTMAERIEPGIFTTAGMLVAASTYDIPKVDEGLSPDEFCITALEHLEYVEGAPVTQADMYHLAHITLATYLLGFNLSGKMIKKDIDKESFEKAKKSVMEVNQSVCDGNPLTEYREIWFKLAQSMLSIRRAQFETEKQNKYIKDAFRYAKKAYDQAKDYRLKETASWVQNTIASFIEALVLAKLTVMKNIKVFKVRQKV